jgi:hypothetical protein
MSRHEVMFEYMKTYPNISNLFSFDFAEAKNNSSAFRVIDEETTRRDIVGNEETIYTFSIAEYKNYTTEPYSTENIENLEEIDDFIEWVREQNRLKILPDFGDGFLVDEIRAMRSGSGIAYVDPSGRIAQYQFTVKVKYTRSY